MKKILLFLLIVSISLFFGCTPSETSNLDTKNETTIIVGAPKSPATIPVLRMIETKALGENVNIELKIYSSMEKMMALATGEGYDFLEVPVNAASVLYNKGLNVKLLSVTLWGGMYLSTTDPNCESWKDLNGKQVYVPNKGSVPDLITQHFLNKNGLNIGENVEVVYAGHSEIAQLIQSGKIKYAIDVEPFVTGNKENIENYRVISDFVNEWKQLEGDEYSMPNFGVITNNNFLQNNGKLVKVFNEEHDKAMKWVLDNPEEAGKLAEQHLNSNKDLITKAIPSFKFEFKTAMDAKDEIEKYCSVLLDLRPESIGGKIPDEDFYYGK